VPVGFLFATSVAFTFCFNSQQATSHSYKHWLKSRTLTYKHFSLNVILTGTGVVVAALPACQPARYILPHKAAIAATHFIHKNIMVKLQPAAN